MKFPSYLTRVFYFLFFNSKVSNLCNSEVLFSLNASPSPYSPSKTFFWTKLCSKNENIHLRDFKILFSNMDLNFAHFLNLNCAHFEVEESFGLIWVNLQKMPIALANFHFRYFKGARFRYGL